MKDDTLDQATDAELNELFAVEVYGFMKDTEPHRIHVWRDYVANYSTDANAVLPWLEKYEWQLTRFCAGQPEAPLYWINLPMGRPDSVEAEASTFARAACIALIRARRAGK